MSNLDSVTHDLAVLRLELDAASAELLAAVKNGDVFNGNFQAVLQKQRHLFSQFKNALITRPARPDFSSTPPTSSTLAAPQGGKRDVGRQDEGAGTGIESRTERGAESGAGAG
jgi:hypothetical protein